MLIQCLVSLLSCKWCFDYLRLCYSEHLYKFGGHRQSLEWHCLVMSMHNFITCVTDSQTVERSPFLLWIYLFSYIVANFRVFLLPVSKKKIVKDNIKFIILTMLSVRFSSVQSVTLLWLWTFSSCGSETLYPLNSHSLRPPASGTYSSAFPCHEFDCSGDLTVGGIIQYLPFCDWLIWLSIMY